MGKHGKYLQQIKTGYIYIWTEIQAKRTDMREIDDTEAERVLVDQQMTKDQRDRKEKKQEKELLAKKEEAKKEAEKEEPETDKELPDDESEGGSVDEDSDNDIDPDIKMLEEIRLKGKGKKQVEIYMKKNYGIDLDRRLNLDTLVDQAVAYRKEQLQEKAA